MAKKAKKKGRPTRFSQGIVDTLCERISNGESLRSVCEDTALPDKATVLRWLSDRKEFCDQYARAREAQADFIADEILEIADDGSNDYVERKHHDGSVGTVFDAENVQRSRLRIDARKWKASKMAPKKYGDKITQELTGKDGGAIIKQIERIIVKAPDPDG